MNTINQGASSGEGPAALLQLAERVEAAAGPDRELDARIFATLGGHDFDKSALAGTATRDWDAPAYTASIDAAMSLVPEGCYTKQGTYPARSRPPAWAQVYDPKLPDFSYNEVAAATPALALCAAALKARAAQGDGE